jgi:hypothetical protein
MSERAKGRRHKVGRGVKGRDCDVGKGKRQRQQSRVWGQRAGFAAAGRLGSKSVTFSSRPQILAKFAAKHSCKPGGICYTNYPREHKVNILRTHTRQQSNTPNSSPSTPIPGNFILVINILRQQAIHRIVVLFILVINIDSALST